MIDIEVEGPAWTVALADAEALVRLAAEAVSLLHDYQPLWLARNRPGGYAESAGRLETMRDGYQR